MIEKILGMPPNASSHGGEMDYVMLLVHILMVVLFIGWGAFFLFVLFRFRKSNHPKADYHGVKSHFSSYLEGVIVIVEIILLVGFSIPFWVKKVNAAQNPSADALHLRVVAQQFAWNVHYPGLDGKFGQTDIKHVKDSEGNYVGLIHKGDGKDDVVSQNNLYLPVNKPVLIDVTSRDVIHSFALPLFRVKQDAIPGMSIPVYFTPTKTTEQVRKELAKKITLPYAKPLVNYVPMEDYGKGEDDKPIAAKGKPLTPELLAKLTASGIREIEVGPSTPTEIICAQLCGSNHFRMRGYVNIVTQEEYDKWLTKNSNQAIEDAEADEE